jgi:ornithine decarboxylase
MIKLLFVSYLMIFCSLFSQNYFNHTIIQSAENVLNKDLVRVIEDKFNFINEQLIHPCCEDTFHIVDIGVLEERLAFWQKYLPNVTPYYAVKTNHDVVITAVLARLGLGFDCASKKEIEQILNLGVDSSKIIFAHPRKPISAIAYAKEKDVNLMTFDSIEELDKLRQKMRASICSFALVHIF